MTDEMKLRKRAKMWSDILQLKTTLYIAMKIENAHVANELTLCNAYAPAACSASGHSTQSAKRVHRLAVSRTHQKFHHEFSVFECMKMVKIMLRYPHIYNIVWICSWL